MRKPNPALAAVTAVLAALALTVAAAAPAPAQDPVDADAADVAASTKRVFDFVKGCGHYFIATVEGDQPRVRPFSSLSIYEGRIYFQTGKVKNVSRQLLANSKIEIVAYDGQNWIRVQAVAVEDDRLEAKQFMLDQMPELKEMYSADDGNTQVFYLKDVTATLSSFSGEGWTETF